MKIRILGAGWYGCHLAKALIADGHEVSIHETKTRIFNGASGRIPARLHLGAHYPRSHATRAACRAHAAEFMAHYGHLTRAVPVNLYAIAADHSLIDFAQYVATLQGEFPFIPVHDPSEFGLRDVEGAILTGERHILSNAARLHFELELDGAIRCSTPPPGDPEDPYWDLTIDCTFCANDAAGIDRYEPCLVLLLEGPTDTAITIMDGPFGSLYPWDPDDGLCSLSSALWTPFSKTIRSYTEARVVLGTITKLECEERGERMVAQMRGFYPEIDEYRVIDHMVSIRAMPLSGCDTRLCEVVRSGPRLLRVRAGKIDAVIEAERQVRALIG